MSANPNANRHAWASFPIREPHAWPRGLRVLACSVTAVATYASATLLADATDASGRDAQRAALNTLAARLDAATRTIAHANTLRMPLPACADAAPRLDDASLLGWFVGLAHEAGMTLAAFEPQVDAKPAPTRSSTPARRPALGQASDDLPDARTIRIRASGPYAAAARFAAQLADATDPDLIGLDTVMTADSIDSAAIVFDASVRILDRRVLPMGHDAHSGDASCAVRSVGWRRGARTGSTHGVRALVDPFDPRIAERISADGPSRLLGTFVRDGRQAALLRVAGGVRLLRPGQRLGTETLLAVTTTSVALASANRTSTRTLTLEVRP